VLWLRSLLCYGEYDCKLKKFREILLTTLALTNMTSLTSYEDFQFET
jgi:hypothetical protein